MGHSETTSLRPLHIETPLVHSLKLSRIAGRDVYLKLENVQPGGSFKIRGVGHMCAKAKAQGYSMIVSSSGGNAGAAVALAGRMLGMKVLVFVPSTTPPYMRAILEAEGAQVKVHGDVWAEADREARKALADAPQGTAVYVPPFDHPDIWEGHATMVEEIKRQLPQGEKPAAIAVSVGGGGLFLGVERGLHRVGWEDLLLVECETEGAACFAKAIASNELITLPAITSIAKTLGASTVAEECLEVVRRGGKVESFVMSDRDAVSAVVQFADDHRLLVEPSCGAALAYVYSGGASRIAGDGPLVVVVCGGNMTSLALVEEWRRAFDV